MTSHRRGRNTGWPRSCHEYRVYADREEKQARAGGALPWVKSPGNTKAYQTAIRRKSGFTNRTKLVGPKHFLTVQKNLVEGLRLLVSLILFLTARNFRASFLDGHW